MLADGSNCGGPDGVLIEPLRLADGSWPERCFTPFSAAARSESDVETTLVRLGGSMGRVLAILYVSKEQLAS